MQYRVAQDTHVAKHGKAAFPGFAQAGSSIESIVSVFGVQKTLGSDRRMRGLQWTREGDVLVRRQHGEQQAGTEQRKWVLCSEMWILSGEGLGLLRGRGARA